MVTALEFGAHGAPGVIVQVNWYVWPGINPLTVAFGLVGSEKVTPVWPDDTVQSPVTGEGLFPCKTYVVALQISLLAPAFATTAGGFMVIAEAVEFANAQTPLLITALYSVVWVRFRYGCVVLVLTIGTQVVPLSMDDSHLTTLPTWPVNVIEPLTLLPEQKLLAPAVVPPTEGRSFVIVTELELGVQGADGVIVQVNWYTWPATNPLTVAFGRAGFEKVTPVCPEVIVQRPVPGDGLLPCRT
jgi:hypothetical protein